EQAQHEVDDDGLACAGGAYQSDPLAGADLEVQVLDDSFFLAVMEGNILETDIACSLVHDARIRRILDGRTLRDDAGRILYRRIGTDKAVDVEHHVARHLVPAGNQAHSSNNRSSGGVATHPAHDRDGGNSRHHHAIQDEHRGTHAGDCATRDLAGV